MFLNAAQFHLITNHLPVIVPLVGVLILSAGLIFKSSPIQKTGLSLLILSLFLAIPAYLTGAPAEKLIKNYPGITRLGITQHSIAAWYAFISIGIIGIASTALLIIVQLGKSISAIIWFALLSFSLISIVLLGWTAHLGGQIRHEEIQTEEQLTLFEVSDSQ